MTGVGSAAQQGETRPWVVPSRALVAQFFGVSVQGVGKWIENGCPGARGAYDLRQILLWLDRRGVRRGGDPEEAERARQLRRRLDEAEVLDREASARIKAARAAQAEGQVVTRAEHHAERRRIVLAFVGSYERLPAELAAKLANKPTAECKTILSAWSLAERERLHAELSAGKDAQHSAGKSRAGRKRGRVAS